MEKDKILIILKKNVTVFNVLFIICHLYMKQYFTIVLVDINPY